MERRRSARRVRRTCFHPLGEHAETSFVIDSQPVSDQQSRIFSIQLSPNAQSVEVLTGVPPAESATRRAWSRV
jgi:hypothetical protein